MEEEKLLILCSRTGPGIMSGAGITMLFQEEYPLLRLYLNNNGEELKEKLKEAVGLKKEGYKNLSVCGFDHQLYKDDCRRMIKEEFENRFFFIITPVINYKHIRAGDMNMDEIGKTLEEVKWLEEEPGHFTDNFALIGANLHFFLDTYTTYTDIMEESDRFKELIEAILATDSFPDGAFEELIEDLADGRDIFSNSPDEKRRRDWPSYIND